MATATATALAGPTLTLAPTHPPVHLPAPAPLDPYLRAVYVAFYIGLNVQNLVATSAFWSLCAGDGGRATLRA